MKLKGEKFYYSSLHLNRPLSMEHCHLCVSEMKTFILVGIKYIQ